MNRQDAQQNNRKQSKYAQKRSRPESMMYGPGCCAHAVTAAQVERAKTEARRRESHPIPAWALDEAP